MVISYRQTQRFLSAFHFHAHKAVGAKHRRSYLGEESHQVRPWSRLCILHRQFFLSPHNPSDVGARGDVRVTRVALDPNYGQASLP